GVADLCRRGSGPGPYRDRDGAAGAARGAGGPDPVPVVGSVQLHHRSDPARRRRAQPQMEASRRRQHLTVPQGRVVPRSDQGDVMTDIDNKPEVAAPEELSEPMLIPVEAYVSEEYARAERDRLWRKVWLQVGRVEELPEVGSYL